MIDSSAVYRGFEHSMVAFGRQWILHKIKNATKECTNLLKAIRSLKTNLKLQIMYVETTIKIPHFIMFHCKTWQWLDYKPAWTQSMHAKSGYPLVVYVLTQQIIVFQISDTAKKSIFVDPNFRLLWTDFSFVQKYQNILQSMLFISAKPTTFNHLNGNLR